MSLVYTTLPHNRLMSVKTLETQKNAHHPTLATPALVLLLQNLSSQPCTMHSWFDALLSDMAFRLLMALSQIQDGCHSWQPAIHQTHLETALLLLFAGIKRPAVLV